MSGLCTAFPEVTPRSKENGETSNQVHLRDSNDDVDNIAVNDYVDDGDSVGDSDDAIPSPEPVSSKNTTTTKAVGTTHSSHEEPHRAHDYHTVSNLPQAYELVGVYWPNDNLYYPGIMAEITDDGNHVIFYDDSDLKTLNW